MHVPSLHLPRLHGRHISLVPHRHADRRAARHAIRTQEGHGVRVARSVTSLAILATILFAALWTLAALGYADAGWWPAVVILAISVVAALGAWLTYWLDR